MIYCISLDTVLALESIVHSHSDGSVHGEDVK
jgi:hypothetical protein